MSRPAMPEPVYNFNNGDEVYDSFDEVDEQEEYENLGEAAPGNPIAVPPRQQTPAAPVRVPQIPTNNQSTVNNLDDQQHYGGDYEELPDCQPPPVNNGRRSMQTDEQDDYQEWEIENDNQEKYEMPNDRSVPRKPVIMPYEESDDENYEQPNEPPQRPPAKQIVQNISQEENYEAPNEPPQRPPAKQIVQNISHEENYEAPNEMPPGLEENYEDPNDFSTNQSVGPKRIPLPPKQNSGSSYDNMTSHASSSTSSNTGTRTPAASPAVRLGANIMAPQIGTGVNTVKIKEKMASLKRVPTKEGTRNEQAKAQDDDENTQPRFSAMLRNFEQLSTAQPNKNTFKSVSTSTNKVHAKPAGPKFQHTRTDTKPKTANTRNVSMNTDDSLLDDDEDLPMSPPQNFKQSSSTGMQHDQGAIARRQNSMQSNSSVEDNESVPCDYQKRFSERNKDMGCSGSAQQPPAKTTTAAVSKDPLSCHEWYFGDITRESCEEKLRTYIHENGTYVVRIHGSIRGDVHGDPDNPYTLSVVYQKHIYHLLIRRRSDQKFALGKSKPDEKVFTTVPEMIHFHQNNFLELVGDDKKKTVSGTVHLKLCPPK